MPQALQLVSLGMATLDIFVRALSPSGWRSGMALDAMAIESGGMACNAAYAAVKLGAQVGFIGTIGSDNLGKLKGTLLQHSGLDTSRCLLRASPDDQVVLVHVDNRSGERSFFPLAAPHRKVIEPGELEREYILQADYLLLDGFHPEASLQAAEWMHEAGKQVMLDANVHHGPPDAATFSLVQRTDYLICSSGFLQALAKTPQLDQAAQVVLGLGPHTIVQTEGEKGSYTFTHRESFHTPAFPVSVVDTTGAGDVFHGAYLVGLLHGWDARKCARFASAAAAFKCQKLGREGYPKLPELPFI